MSLRDWVEQKKLEMKMGQVGFLQRQAETNPDPAKRERARRQLAKLEAQITQEIDEK